MKDSAKLMILGSLVGVALIIFTFIFPAILSGQASMALFAAGALFGKGYGIWEARK